jgi:adenylate cyclase
LTAAGLFCGSCGTELPSSSKFCNECGAPVTQLSRSAEYKQVTVLFADVVHSMGIAAAVGAERLREIMADLVNRAAVVVQRYGGTVGSFTGDGIMAVFGAPVALEDHAIRACLAALGVQEEAKRLAVDVQDRDGVDLWLRVGLNSGQVIAGEIGSGALGYTAIGEQVGMAQRMESVAPPGGVMLSDSIARLVEGVAVLGEPELVLIKGADAPVRVCRLLGMEQHRAARPAESRLVGRQWEMSAVQGLLDRAIDGHGGVVGVVGPPGIGKSRLVREVAAMAAQRGVQVFTAFCESHTSQVPFHVVTRLLRAATGVEGVDAPAARALIRAQGYDADSEDVTLFEDLLGIGDAEAALPQIDPDARRRRLTALVNAATLANKTPAVYVIEDAHWIDEVSESMLADFLTVIPHTPLLTLITYRPEYRGALAQVAGAQTLALARLSDPETAALVSELLGTDPSVVELGKTITERAAGTPFFAEEIVRELAERGVLHGQTGAYVSTAQDTDVRVPATLQATIAARIDRLDPEAKRTVTAAAVIGSRFSLDLLAALGVEPVVADLVAAQLIDQVTFTRQPEFVFHHPLIRAVAYEAQLMSDRTEMHRRLAAAIEGRDVASVDENAAMIAEHLEAAGDLHEAFAWHMRAGKWSSLRDIKAARMSWRRARQVADALPADDPDRGAMRILPRTALCLSAWRAGGSTADTDELRSLAAAADDNVSLALAMTGQVLALLFFSARYREASLLGAELTSVTESIHDPVITVGVLPAVTLAKYEAGDMVDVLRLSQRVIDLADGDPMKGKGINPSPLAMAIMVRGLAGCSLGSPGWKDDLDKAIAMASAVDVTSRIYVNPYVYLTTIPNGALLADADILCDTAETLTIAERSSDDFGLATARAAHGLVLVQRHGEDRSSGFDLLAAARQAALQQRYEMTFVRMIDILTAKEKLRLGDIDGAEALSRAVFEDLFDTGLMLWRGPALTTLVESLLARGGNADLQDAQTAIDRLAAAPSHPSFVFHELPLLRLRALLAQAHEDDAAYCDYRDRYRAMATSLGFEGHIAWAEAMP